MLTIGLLGGMSWESSAEYYRIINQEVRSRLGGAHSAKTLMLSVDFAEVERLQHDGQWDRLAVAMCDAARALERGGAEMLIVCTNTMHRMADEIAAAVAIPLLHIADPTAQAVAKAGFGTVGLLGTAFTMEQAFYKDRLADRYGLRVVIPETDDRRAVHEIIYRELVSGLIYPQSRDLYRHVIESLVDRGAESVILGCTEIGILISQEDSAVPLFDTTKLHALAAVDWALGGATNQPIG